MASLNSHCPPLGTEIDIYTNANQDISMTVSNFTLRSTVIGVYVFGIGHTDYLLGWNSNPPSSKYARSGYRHVGNTQLQHSKFSADVDMYAYYCWVMGKIEVATVHVQSAMNAAATAPQTNWKQALANHHASHIALAKNRSGSISTDVSDDQIVYADRSRVFPDWVKLIPIEKRCSNPTCGKMNDVVIGKTANCWWCQSIVK